MPTVKDPHYPVWFDRRASNVQLIATSRSAIARGRRLVDTSEELMRVSAKLMPRSSLAAPPPQTSARERQAEADDLAHQLASAERRETEALRQIGYSLRSYAEEMIVTAQELRWQACQTRMQAQAQRARAQAGGQAVRRSHAQYCGRGDLPVIVDGLNGYGVEVRRPESIPIHAWVPHPQRRAPLDSGSEGSGQTKRRLTITDDGKSRSALTTSSRG